jgi:hypothetical protein
MAGAAATIQGAFEAAKVKEEQSRKRDVVMNQNQESCMGGKGRLCWNG